MGPKGRGGEDLTRRAPPGPSSSTCRVVWGDRVCRASVGDAADPDRPKRVISSAGRADAVEAPAEAPPTDEKPAPLLGNADPEFEKLLDAEEEIDRLSRENSETERFRPGQVD